MQGRAVADLKDAGLFGASLDSNAVTSRSLVIASSKPICAVPSEPIRQQWPPLVCLLCEALDISCKKSSVVSVYADSRLLRVRSW